MGRRLGPARGIGSSVEDGGHGRRPPRWPSSALRTRVTWFLTSCTALVITGCGSAPPHRYAVDSVEIHGMEDMDSRALEACLATKEREALSLNLGLSSDPECGVPPFDSDAVELELWTWPWTDWPLYDLTVFSRDVERVERWYRARGYYEARVVSTRLSPSEAAVTDRCDAEDCELAV